MSQKGLAPVVLIGIIAVLILAGASGFLVLQEKKVPSSEKTVQRSETIGLGDLCFGKEECVNFCQDNRGRCEDYCKGNKIELCKIIFPPGEIYATDTGEAQLSETQPELKPKLTPPIPLKEKVGTKNEDDPPILKNLGIVLDMPNIQTKRAGDMIFDKIVVWEDGGSSNDKAFGEFGEMGKRKDAPNYPGVEYNFAAPIGTKVYAAGDGIARIFYIEHTQDWGINIKPREGSKWNIGHEHIVNLIIKDGEIIRAGDVLGEATPNRMGWAITQLAVWTGGRDGIVKYCPFPFLEDDLEPSYEEKLKRIAKDWEEFTGKDVYRQENWVAPGCLLDKIQEQ